MSTTLIGLVLSQQGNEPAEDGQEEKSLSRDNGRVLPRLGEHPWATTKWDASTYLMAALHLPSRSPVQPPGFVSPHP